jgi:hypothetical protein
VFHFSFFFSDGQFKLFAPVSDKAFVIFVGAVEGLHIAAIGLLGHLLGFHLYLSKYMLFNLHDVKLLPFPIKCDSLQSHSQVCTL